MLTRRWFTYTLMGLIALGSTRPTDVMAADPRVTSTAVGLEGPLSRDVFRALVREPFSLLLENRSAGLFLLRIDDNDARPDSEQFTVVFQAPRELTLLDGTYLISHITAGTTAVFLQSAGHDDRYNYYKAPFNVLRKGAGVQAPTPRRDGGRGWRVVP